MRRGRFPWPACLSQLGVRLAQLGATAGHMQLAHQLPSTSEKGTFSHTKSAYCEHSHQASKNEVNDDRLHTKSAYCEHSLQVSEGEVFDDQLHAHS